MTEQREGLCFKKIVIKKRISTGSWSRVSAMSLIRIKGRAKTSSRRKFTFSEIFGSSDGEKQTSRQILFAPVASVTGSDGQRVVEKGAYI